MMQKVTRDTGSDSGSAARLYYDACFPSENWQHPSSTILRLTCVSPSLRTLSSSLASTSRHTHALSLSCYIIAGRGGKDIYIFLYFIRESRHDAATGEKFIQGINFAKLKPPQHEERTGDGVKKENRKMKTEGE